ncbi:MAG: hypothetical protein KDD89_01175 [Anaerolineales bacterium]|nr:hypothetical protein [Anaerolineales bacterium]
MAGVAVDSPVMKWLLDSDVSLQYQVFRDLLDVERPDLQQRIAVEGWGAHFLSLRQPTGHWGQGFYAPKWRSSHYTLLDLKHLALAQDNTAVQETIQLILSQNQAEDGGINPGKTIKQSDVCVNGMFLNYAAYFQTPEKDLQPIVDFLIAMQMPDRGFNCRSNRQGAQHSSLHSTISVLEGIREYLAQGYTYRHDELRRIEAGAWEFLLIHRLFRSDRTGEIIHPRFLRLSYPSRWFYDILRALVYWAESEAGYDERLADALQVLQEKRRPDGKWPLQARHPGEVHFQMEPSRQPSRWNTLRALRVLRRVAVEQAQF